MDDIVISVENLSKKYDLGVIGTGTFSKDLNRWWARMRRQPDPYAKIGEVDHGNRLGQTILALDDISFDVKRGETLGIIGRNGAGKSTLLKILSQVTAPSSGKVKIKGRIGSLLEVGTGFHPELTGRENLYLNGAILGMSKAEVNRKFDEIVDFSGVEKFIDTPVKRYSSGMYVRLAFAVAAHLEPEILIVDEVLAVGDAEFQKKCLGKMSDVAHEGRTVLFVSHNMGAVNRLCNQCMVLSHGSIVINSTTEEAVQRYLTENSSGLTRSKSFHEELSDPIQFVNIEVISPTRGDGQAFEISDELSFHISYKVNSKIIGSNLSFALKKDGILLFYSWDIDMNNDDFLLREPGIYRTRIAIPQNILTTGIYTVDIAAGQPGKGVIVKHSDCLNFEIQNNFIDSSHKSYLRGGMISIPLHWKTVKESVLEQ